MAFKLSYRTLLKLSGSDAESFLQAQLSNDISKLDDNRVQLSAYCQHQGKILALFWVMRDGDDFLLSFHADLVDGLGRLGSYGHTLGTLFPPEASSGSRPNRVSN